MSYSSIPGVNISTLKAIWSQSPLHYRHLVDHGREETAAMALGTATHLAILEPERFAARYTRRPDGIDLRTRDGKAWAAQVATTGRTVLTGDEYDRILGMRDACRANWEVSRYLDAPGEVEGVITWRDEETGIECKGRYDKLARVTCAGLTDHVLFGLKTTRVATPRTFMTQATRLGYHLQWAFYHDGLAASGITPAEVVEAVVESSAPHDCILYVIPPEVLEVGREEYRRALATLAECRANDTWPGHAPTGRLTFSLPQWAIPWDDEDTSDLDLTP